MFELEFFDKETEELLEERTLSALTNEDVYRIFGFHLEGNCADVDFEQLKQIESIVGGSFNREGRDVFICEVQG
ncbi:DUF7683 domain-containing protein [Enterovibrio norvegicus]|uniref:DUF7683 domain-containing protein n=1 Tax=Enterovibrio norvegicus DSM 15893 TaxID=1121869 RepID=A0A1I5XTS8_9GAMM|nr:hypothetical protein [Enterovibrio norvegicus]SFQ35137.1 hypothetical protein SAMN03084138_04828 [Enterovibrio norvegicus DSM 15893]